MSFERKSILVTLPQNQREWLKKVSDDFGLTQSEIVQFLIADAMRNEENFRDKIISFFFGDAKPQSKESKEEV